METTVLTRLLEITVYSAAIFLAVVLFRFAFKKQLSPNLKYALWLIVLLRLTVPVTFDSAFHLITLPEATATPVATVAGAQQAWITPTPAFTMEPANPGVIVPTATASVDTESVPAAKPAKRLNYKQWLLLLWAAGALAVFAAEIRLAIRLNKRIRARGVAPDAATKSLFESVKTRMHVKRNLEVLLIDDIRSPALTVQLSPKLLLPDGLVDHKSREEQSFSISHELMHYKRCDHLVLLLISALRAVYWFNPIVWILPRFLRTDMESACDAQVVRRMDRQQKLKYANLLLDLGQKEREL